MASSPQGQRLALVVEYDGTNYAGFQLQATEPTIQGEIERALFRFTGERIRIRGASRTDSGAHALGQVVDFVSCARYPAETFVSALNFYLPEDIRIVKATEAEAQYNSRRDAESRVYRYLIWNRHSPPALLRKQSYWIREPLDIQRMNKAARGLIGTHDFRAFAPSHPRDRSTVRQVHRWETSTGQEIAGTISITCEANGFMQHQIRRTNAVLVEIGKGKLPTSYIEECLEGTEDRQETLMKDSIPTLPARGLCLVEVKYRNMLTQGERQNETN